MILIILIIALVIAYIRFDPRLDTIIVFGERYVIIWYWKYGQSYEREYRVLFKLPKKY